MNQEIMKTMGFKREIDEVNKGICPFCHKHVKIEDFRNALSKKEYGISGLCQECQDETFGGD